MSKAAQIRICTDILAERRAQDAKWGPQSHPDGTSAQYKPMADMARDVCQEAADNDETTWWVIFQEEVAESAAEEEWPALRKELIQSLAVGVAWVEDGDRRYEAKLNEVEA